MIMPNGTLEKIVVDNVNRFGVEITMSANRFNLSVPILKGLVAVESGGNPWATRREPEYKWLWGDAKHERPMRRPPGTTYATEIAGQKTSWGLCQIMGATARWIGYGSYFPRLCDPAVGTLWGAKYLQWCLKRAKGDMTKALKRYNGANDYPPKVFKWAKLFETSNKEKKE